MTTTLRFTAPIVSDAAGAAIDLCMRSARRFSLITDHNGIGHFEAIVENADSFTSRLPDTVTMLNETIAA